ncbi:hypothetical protein CK203_098000 [Vitis vinifera]|uniref:Uncharacterized protein n=1 Tax=Vitis vinifera TaxID=29760 RepID=A0A438CKS5_VITVI|nr:hypothetical protein CK203_098000 [Vitis vinifera]
MLTQPPIEGEFGTAELGHSTLSCALTQATFQLRPELANSFRLLRRYHMEHSVGPRETSSTQGSHRFLSVHDYKQVRDPTFNPFYYRWPAMTFWELAILAEALHIPYEPTHFEDFRVWTSPLSWRWCISCPEELPHRRGVLLEALFKISEGYFFGPYHLIMVTLLYFEEKVHKKKLQRADAIPLLFPRLLCQILEHLGYPTDPQLERKRQPHPAARRASPRHIPKGIPIASPAISRAPPITPASSQPSSLAELRDGHHILEYRELCCSLQTLTASQSCLAQEMATIRACQE